MKPITINNRRYASLIDCAYDNGIPYVTLKKRIKRYGIDSPKLIKPTIQQTGIVLNNKHYKSIAQAARQHNLRYMTLEMRIRKFGKDSDKLFIQPHPHKQYKKHNLKNKQDDSDD